ncbi:DNA topoisomerase-3 [Chthoniobacter flavus]|nr:DNA topoisomerase III [Chthoniobacter flavus]TCO86131.1 DNA topoisomerase-3 [Chthoniobacter flavus]
MKTLVIAEKPSVASDLAKALGVKKAGDWFENDSYVISSAVGHLLELAVPEEHEIKRGKWTMEKLPHIPPQFALAPIDKNAGRLAQLRKLIKRKEVTELINACDAGREGELIFRNIVKATGAKQPIKRLWLQSMTPDAIRTAFANLRSDADMQPLADAAVSRSESDWLVGINSTRALTAFNSQGGGFSKTTAGRVQTPTLAILVEREEKIRAFEPRAYWEVFGDFGVKEGSYRGRWFDPAFKKNGDEDGRAERIWDKVKADAIKAKCDGQPGTVEEEKKPTTQAPPLLYDLTTLQREANGRHGFPAKMTLQIAQALYEKHKVLTYPRTDSRYLPEDHVATAKRVMNSFEDRTLAGHAEKALRENWVRPNKRIFNNAKVSDHFAIVPTGTAPKNLSETEQKIFDMVSRRFVAVFYPAAQFEVTTRITTVVGEKFKTDGKIIVDPGWLAVYGRQAEGEGESDKAIVAITPGEQARTEAIEVKENITKPPPRYNEATLLSAMEGAGRLVDDEELREAMSERGLGTPATRAQVIEGLLFEGYLIRQGRELIVTAKGISLITLLRNLHAETLTKPELTGEWEHKLRQMERGQLSRGAFMDQIRGLTTEIVSKVRGGMGQEVRGNFKDIDVACPKCGTGPFKESFKAFECRNPECKLIVWKTMSGREFEREEVAKLLTEGRVGPLEGFRSKLGRAFNAEIILNEKTEWKQKFDFEDSNGEGENGMGKALDLSQAKVLGETPQGTVYETENAFLCMPAGNGSKKPIRMGKNICQRAIPAEQALKIFTEGKTDLLPRFISKKGKPFSAYLKLDGAKVTFEFEPRQKKAKAPPAKKTPPSAEAEG